MRGARSQALWLCVASFLRLVSPHGFLYEPPQRSSLWRHGYNTTKNYDDNALNCGGRSKQHETNGGRCGLCGDAFDDVRNHEVGGKYYTDIIPRYYKIGSDVNVTIRISKNHKGYFEFRLCPETGLDSEGFQECLDRNLLQVRMRDHEGRFQYFISTDRQGDYNLIVTLPVDMTCDRCLFQWRYVTDKDWGEYPEEWFVNCADIGIYAKEPPSTTQKTRPFKTTQRETTLTGTSTRETTRSSTLTPDQPLENKCKPVERFARVPGMDWWCDYFCNIYCYSVVCICSNSNNV